MVISKIVGGRSRVMNIRRTSALADNVCPRVLFTVTPVDYKKELSIAFGDYVESYEGTDNTSRARSSMCIALYPTAKLYGCMGAVEGRVTDESTPY
jgi:hypothetical protein